MCENFFILPTINDVDFDKAKIIVQPKPDSRYIWRWVVKDKERRELPLVKKAAQLLANIQTELPSTQPYLLLPAKRYGYVMNLKKVGKLKDRVAKCPDNNFRRNWLHICKMAGLENATFHDLRATCITEWFEQGLMPHEIQRLTGHASIETTMRYYVGIRETMIDRARLASTAAMDDNLVARQLRAPQKAEMGIKKAVSRLSYLPDTARLPKIGATGLEPATS